MSDYLLSWLGEETKIGFPSDSVRIRNLTAHPALRPELHHGPSASRIDPVFVPFEIFSMIFLSGARGVRALASPNELKSGWVCGIWNQ